MKRVILKERTLLVILFLVFAIHASGIVVDGKHKKIYYNNKFTYVIVDFDNHKVSVYNIDKSPHPVFVDKYRGTFCLTHLTDDFYYLDSQLPGKRCVNNIIVRKKDSNLNNLVVKINLCNAQSKYLIQAKRVGTDSIYQILYPKDKELKLPTDDVGYVFSILPDSDEITEIDGITYGFSHTIKFLTFSVIGNGLLKLGGQAEISLPQFYDGIFSRWCINGDIIQLNNDNLIWHGQVFKEYTKELSLPDTQAYFDDNLSCDM